MAVRSFSVWLSPLALIGVVGLFARILLGGCGVREDRAGEDDKQPNSTPKEHQPNRTTAGDSGAVLEPCS